MDEAQAIALLKRGDLLGLEVLVHRYYFQAVRASYLIVRDNGQAEDIVQTAFLNASNKINQLSSNNFGPWFIRSVIHASIKASEKQKRLISLDTEDEETERLTKWLMDTNPSIEEMIETDELRQDVWNALGKLTASQRASIVLKYFLEMSEAEIAVEFKLPQSTVKWRLYTARERLRKLLKPLRNLTHSAKSRKSFHLSRQQEHDHE
jgi:RNA polymerase sigma-70 factor (ECF subfamily)